MRRPPAFLILSAVCADAVRLQTRRHDGPPVVAGTQILDAEEMQGKKPILVDAFPDSTGAEVSVVLSFSPLFSKKVPAKSPEWLRWTSARWECEWGTGDLSMMREAAQEGLGMVTKATILYDTANMLETLPSALFSNQSTVAEKRSKIFHWFHHALVLGCPVPSQLASSSTRYLTLTAGSSSGGVFYRRAHVPVARTAMVQPGTGSVLCTMLFEERDTVSVLLPWAKYHLDLGFDQILLYVEDSDTSWASSAIQGLADASKLTVVPFYFGKVSSRRDFIMQAAMETHCLYQARDRASWLAHADIDEYFDIRQPGVEKISDYLRDHAPPDAGAISVRSQFWTDAGADGPHGVPFPCKLTCRAKGYFASGTRSKWIARPSRIRIVNPHIVKTTDSSLVHAGDPEKEIRLNHFRKCPPLSAAKRSSGDEDCMRPEQCRANGTFDESFASRCAKSVGR